MAKAIKELQLDMPLSEWVERYTKEELEGIEELIGMGLVHFFARTKKRNQRSPLPQGPFFAQCLYSQGAQASKARSKGDAIDFGQRPAYVKVLVSLSGFRPSDSRWVFIDWRNDSVIE